MPCPLRERALASPRQCLVQLAGQHYAGVITSQVSAALLDTWVEQYRHALRDQGVKKDDRLMVLTTCSLDTIILMVACLRSQIIFCPLNPLFPEKRIVEYGRNIGASWLVSGGEQVDKAVGCMIVVSRPAKAVEARIPEKKLTIDAETVMDLVATSGTTGVPKAVAHSYYNHFYSAVGSQQVIPLTGNDSWLLSLPLFHVGGLAIVFRSLLAGACMWLYQKTVPLSHFLKKASITHLSLVNTQLYRLLEIESADLFGLGVRYILLGGGVASPGLVKKAQSQGVRVLTTYGMTEMSSQVCTGEPVFNKTTVSSGSVLSYRELRLAADGEILVKGKPLALGYYKEGSLIPFVDNEGWYHTGDRGEWFAGQLLVKGRMDNMMISGGENIHPEEIEQALMGLPEIIQAVVVAVGNKEFGQRPIAYVQTTSGLLDELFTKHQLEGKIAKFKIPDRVLLFPESDVYSGIKVNRRLFQQLADKQFS